MDAYAYYASVALAFGALCVLVLLTSTIKIAKEYQRGVVFRFGRLIPLKGPGLFLIFPFGIDRLQLVDLRVITLEVPQQEVITSDNVTVKVNAVIFFQVKDAQAAIVRVANFMEATSQIAQTTLRSVLGQSSLDELLGGREKINARLQTIIDGQTEPWGIKVGPVELKDAQLAETMVRALARQALRYMQTLLDMGSNENSTIVFPIPIELIRPLLAAPVPLKTVAMGNGASLNPGEAPAPKVVAPSSVR